MSGTHRDLFLCNFFDRSSLTNFMTAFLSLFASLPVTAQCPTPTALASGLPSNVILILSSSCNLQISYFPPHWQMLLHPFSHSLHPSADRCYFPDSIVCCCTSYKCLVITPTSFLTWACYVSQIAKNASLFLSFIKRSLKLGPRFWNMLPIYVASLP